MTPAQLQPSSFLSYPPQARAIAEEHVEILRTLPLSFLPLLLRETIAYDQKFPAERRALDAQYAYLESLSAAERKKQLASFEAINVNRECEQMDWVNDPARFTEALSASLWSTHQIDAFHSAATSYMDRAAGTLPSQSPKQPRLAVAIIGQDVRAQQAVLFQKLRPHGVYLTNFDPDGGLQSIGSWLSRRASNAQDPYAHWAISGAEPFASSSGNVTSISYGALTEPRAAMSAVLRRSFDGNMNAEVLRTKLAAMRPADIGLDSTRDPATAWFELSLLSEGSGTQVFATTFVQWAAREALRRAEPETLICRYAPRQRANSMKDLLNPSNIKHEPLDPEGSLVDADMAAYQTWLNLQRLSGATEARFVCWFEAHRQMVVIAPGLKPGTTDNSASTFHQIEQNFLRC